MPREEADDEDFDDAPQPKKKRRKKRRNADSEESTFAERLAAGDRGQMAKYAYIFVGLLVVGGLVYWMVRPGNVIADSQWKVYAVPGVCSLELPGDPEVRSMPICSGIGGEFHQCVFSRDAVFGVGVTRGALPPERASLPVEKLLEDSCDGAAAVLKDMGAKEVDRKTVQFGEHKGREINFKAGNGQLVYRCFVVKNQLIVLMAGGRSFSPNHPNVKRLFDSVKFVN